MAEAVEAPWLGCATPVADFSKSLPMPPEAYFDVTYVDDCAVVMHARHNDRIRHIAQHSVHGISQAARRRGLHVNFEQGKTELVWNTKFIFPLILGMSSSQLTKSYFSEGWPNHQPVFDVRYIRGKG